ncbi:pilus assembly protein [Actinotalea ferrariae]|uniref:TadE/TadG family type IV pilus assembly protein n=1 Tax=Actinotalea ferrariae TaxID=1386098 RepID=UPI001C8C9B19|nr:TadE/TadG family type IV pilus assembly protein [Actinotalea ferrariae]MBX9243804.1 pilus assembly protein [Actinotalea ferrariae]
MIRTLRRHLPATGEDRGSVTVELAILAPALLLLLGALILAGRVQVAAGAVEQAARSAARDASLARTPDQARGAAAAAADRELTAAGITCTTTAVSVDVTGFGAPLGQDAVVRVAVGCTVSMADLAIPGLPGSRTMSAEGISPLDTFRSR